MPARFELPVDHPHVAVVTIDRPERANALDPRTLRDLADAWEHIARDPEIRCAVLTGAGDRVFCAGMDLATTIPASQRLARGERVEPEEFEGLRAVATAMLVDLDLGTPLVCAVNGHARAGGFDLMLASRSATRRPTPRLPWRRWPSACTRRVTRRCCCPGRSPGRMPTSCC